MQPVWVLSVDLQTKTATFQSGLSDAAKSARGAFTQIKSGAGDMGRETSGHMMEARHGVMLLGEEFGVHLPRALTSFIASIGPIGAAMEAAFPFLAIAVGATMLIEHLSKMREAGAKLTEDQVKFGTSVQNVFNALDVKMLQAEKRADELRGDHLGALSKELQILDHQSLADLARQFELIAKDADIVFKGLQRSWYQFGAGSEGAKNALDQFITQYESLQSKDKSGEASGLLAGTLKQAQTILALQKQYTENQSRDGGGGNYGKFEEAAAGLKKLGVSIASTDAGIKDEIASQQKLVDVLNDYARVAQRVADITKKETANDKTATHNTMNNEAEAAAQARAAAVEQERQQRVKAMEETYRDELTQVQEGERQQIDEAREGSTARVAAIDAALQEERDHLAESTGFYRGLLYERTNLVRRMAEEEAQQKEEAGIKAAQQDEKIGAMILADQKRHQAVLDSARRVSDAQRIQEETKFANDEYALKMREFQREEAALDKDGKDYAKKLKQIQDKEKQLIQQHENEISSIKEKAEEERNKRIKSAEDHLRDSLAQGLTQSIMGHQTWAKMVNQLGDQVVSGMIQNAIKSMLTQDMTKEKDAAAAARKAFNIGMSMGPAGIILGPVFGAAAFAAVMAFEGGGIVPGTGSGDIVPAMLTPGEGVVPKGVMEGLSNLSKSGGLSGGTSTTHVHVRPTYHVQTIDGNGMKAALEKHTDVLQRHFEGAVRKMNR
jgi:predicted RNA binding protein with dsRBD fold (UPF0201 family)